MVDRNVLSEPTKAVPHAGVVAWLKRNEREPAVDPIIVGEIRFGILLLPRSQRRTHLERWFDTGVRRLLCLPWEPETGLRWAQLLAKLLATRNRRDFEKAGVEIVDPFAV